MSAPFEMLTEAAGIPIADEAASMMVTRYRTASELAGGGRTLELACGSGPGLRMLSHASRFVVGADINAPLLQQAQNHYRGTIPLVRLSAESLPFRDGSFDFVLFLEATYYVPDFQRALDEILRVLNGSGRVLFVNANPERAGFIRSPFSHHYHSASEFRELLTSRGFRVSASGAFSVDDAVGGQPFGRSVTSLARRTLEALRLVPRTLEGRARLKRLFGHKMRQVPPEIDDTFAPRAPLTPLDNQPARGFKVIYVSAERASH